MASSGDPRVLRTPTGLAPVALPPTRPVPRDAELERVRRMAQVLDRYLVDPVIGLVIPGAGDVVGSLLGLYTVAIAIRRRMSPVIIARMLLNLGVDAAIGIVPLLGDLADVGFKANLRNTALLAERAEHGGRATWRDWLMVIGAALAFCALIGLMIYAIVAVLRAIF